MKSSGLVLVLFAAASLSVDAQESAATVHVKVAESAGGSAITIRLRTHQDQVLIAEQTTDDATFVLLHPGVYKVTVEQEGSSPADSLVRVNPGESVTLVAALASSSGAGGTSRLTVQERSGNAPGHVLDARALRDLPSSNSIDALVETTQAELIGDRLETGGLSVGEPMRIGAHGSSWTQTTYRFGDAELMDPLDAGRPPMLPDVAAVSHVEISSSLMPVERSAPGPDIMVVPRRPSSSWQRTVEGAIADPGLIARNGLSDPPAIARLGTWEFANVALSGPLVPDRLGAVIVASWTGSTRFQRSSTDSVGANAGSAFAHFVFAATPHDEVRALVMAQRRSRPFSSGVPFGQQGTRESDDVVDVQAAWERRVHAAPSWTVTASYLRRQIRPEADSAALVYLDRLRDGPVPDVLSQGANTRDAWSVSARIAPAGHETSDRVHAWRFGVEAAGASVRADAPIAASAAELVAGIPARVWQYSAPGTSRWSDRRLSVYAADHVAIRPHLNLETGLRFETLTAAADGAGQGIGWRDWLPRFSARWQPLDDVDATLFAGVGRYAHRLPLAALAYGDPNAGRGSVYRWVDSNHDGRLQASELGALVARVGPGSGGDPKFSAIDPKLTRPHTDEFVMGIEVRSAASLMFRLSGMARRDASLIAPVNTGVPLGGYARLVLPDPGVDIASGVDTQLLTIYNRLPATFGADRYVLTNPEGPDSTFVGAEATAQLTRSRFQMLIGVTAGVAHASAANRGFSVIENDPGLLGELYTNPNATSWSHGRPFTERGYTIKSSGTYRFPGETTLGVIGRYQDGQHFSRVVVVSSLNQGAEAVNAFPNGLTRFEYTLTFDARLQKRFELGGHPVDGLIDVFNLLNLAKEVEENPVSGPASRRTTAVQPPIALHVGLRWFF